MVAKKLAAPSNDFPVGLSQPARRALAGAGYTRLSQLAKLTEAEALALHGMGPNGIRLLREALKARGLGFAAPKKAKLTGGIVKR